MARRAAFLRAVNVGGRKLAMADLRQVCETLGWAGVETFIQSGNVLFESAMSDSEAETKLEAALRGRFGMEVPVMTRSKAALVRALETNPFTEAAKDEPGRLLLHLTKKAPDPRAVHLLADRAKGGERVAAVEGGLWIHFAGGVGRSRLTPSAIDRAAGSPATARNHRTIATVVERL